MDNTKLTPELLTELRRLFADPVEKLELHANAGYCGIMTVSGEPRWKADTVSVFEAMRIVAAYESLPALLDEIERLRAALDALCWEARK